MPSPLAGVNVVEVTGYVMGSTAGAVLADLGANVIKIEPPTGDPMRGFANSLSEVTDAEGQPAESNPIIEFANRGKRSVCLDLTKGRGREVIYRLAAGADVFLTNYLGDTRRKLRIDVADIRSANPDIIYARGSGWGAKGPMADDAAFDIVSAWAATGMAHLLSDADGTPPTFPIALFDAQTANALAGAIAVALFQRSNTGTTSVVDVSLFNTGLWAVQADVIAAPHSTDGAARKDEAPRNPLVHWYRASDGGCLYFSAAQHPRLWPEFCTILGAPELADDERFATPDLREENNVACVAEISAIFATRTLAEWEGSFQGFSGAWSPVNTPMTVHDHPQIEANGFLNDHQTNTGMSMKLVAPPMQFDEQPPLPQSPAPEAGEHTEEVLLEHGYTWEEISTLNHDKVIGPRG